MGKLFKSIVRFLKSNSRRVLYQAQAKFPEVPLSTFHEVIENDDYNGFCPKENLICDGKYLLDMRHELQSNPDNYFETCVDDLIYDDEVTDEQFSNLKVSTILKKKDLSRIGSASNELICCRLANLFGIRTQYVAPIENHDEYILIVDFLSKRKKFLDFYDYTHLDQDKSYPYNKSNNGEGYIQLWIKRMLGELNRDLSKVPDPVRMRRINHILVDFIRMYIFKRYIVHDVDACVVNFGFTYSKVNFSDIELAPAFDFEKAFCKSYGKFDFNGLDEDIKYLNDNFPEQLKEALSTFCINSNIYQNICDIITAFDNNDKSSSAHSKISFVYKNIGRVNDVYNKILDPECSKEI